MNIVPMAGIGLIVKILVKAALKGGSFYALNRVALGWQGFLESSKKATTYHLSEISDKNKFSADYDL